MTLTFKTFLMMICAVSISIGLAGCQGLRSSKPNAGPCAGFRPNNLSPAGFVALVAVDRPGAERVAGNDRNGARRGCW